MSFRFFAFLLLAIFIGCIVREADAMPSELKSKLQKCVSKAKMSTSLEGYEQKVLDTCVPLALSGSHFNSEAVGGKFAKCANNNLDKEKGQTTGKTVHMCMRQW